MVPEILDERIADQKVALILKRERYRKLKEGFIPMSELKLFIGDKADGSKAVFAIQQAAPISREDLEQLIIDSEAQTASFKTALANFDTLAAALPAPVETPADSAATETTEAGETAEAPTTEAPAAPAETPAPAEATAPAAPVAEAPTAAPIQ